ncbi:MAG TPA: hypothetical protein VEB86_01440 [Chryseosolibacter sp.]|nr:hypothetical protein [Chryseosolibacter sp.]
MRSRLILLNVSFIIYFIGLLATALSGLSTGAVVIIMASLLIAALYADRLFAFVKQNRFWRLELVLYTLAIISIAEIFIQGFSVAGNLSLFGIPGFSSIHALFGVLHLVAFLWFSSQMIQSVGSKELKTVGLCGFGLFAVLNFSGLLSYGRFIPDLGPVLYYSYVFLTFFYLIFFLLYLALNDGPEKTEIRACVGIALAMVLFWVVRWKVPPFMPLGISSVVFYSGFTMLVILPFAIRFAGRFQFLTVFVFYAVVIDFYFISTANNFRYLVEVGAGECQGYDKITRYPEVRDPGVSLDELFKAPAPEELARIIEEWDQKDFSPRDIRLEYSGCATNGDSLKVISHVVAGKRHYGMVRIPAGLNAATAPILLGLHGGGTDRDVMHADELRKIASGSCRNTLDDYITIAPAFRGDIVRGDGFCFCSEGYSGDVWIGAAEDAIAFLEVVKQMYGKSDSTRTLALGVSRGATVGLIAAALTGKISKVIAISTHAQFHHPEPYQHQRVGGSYPAVFFTPAANVGDIRKRLIASSPVYFADRLPEFEIHQGTDDHLTTVFHARALEARLKEIGRDIRSYKIYYYEGKGHGYDDDQLVCRSLYEFARRTEIP